MHKIILAALATVTLGGAAEAGDWVSFPDNPKPEDRKAALERLAEAAEAFRQNDPIVGYINLNLAAEQMSPDARIAAKLCIEYISTEADAYLCVRDAFSRLSGG